MRALRSAPGAVWHLLRDGRPDCGEPVPATYAVADVASLWPKENEICSLCVCLNEADNDSRETATPNRGDATVTAELTRQRYAPQRMTILRELQRHIRNPADGAKEPDQIPFAEFDSPLSPFLKEPKAK